MQCVLNFNTSRWSTQEQNFEKKSCSVYSEAFDTPCDHLNCPGELRECRENHYQTEAKCVCKIRDNFDKEPKSCDAVSQSGVCIKKAEEQKIPVWYDMGTLDGGWTVIQRRKDGSVNFARSWNDYKCGFGNLNGEHWLGLDNIHDLTESDNMDLLIELREYNRSCKLYALYSNFSVGSEAEYYQLGAALTFINGTAREYGNGYHNGQVLENFLWHKGMNFSTFDNDNDQSTANCAQGNTGGWWHRLCRRVSLNGLYSEKRNSFDNNWCDNIDCETIKCKKDFDCGCTSENIHCKVP